MLHMKNIVNKPKCFITDFYNSRNIFALIKAPCRKILRHVHKAKFIPFSSSYCFATTWLLIELPESSGERISSFPLSIPIHHGSPRLKPVISGRWTISSFMTAVQRRSLTPSTCWSSKYLILAGSCNDNDPSWSFERLNDYWLLKKDFAALSSLFLKTSTV
jgi:hypothetical protein